ncbi:MAG: hypothetical protein WBM00_08110 [Solirubrobacterales bacterium]
MKSVATVFVWMGLLMVFPSAAGSLLMLGVLVVAMCGAASLAGYARHGIARAMESVSSSSSPLGTGSRS